MDTIDIIIILCIFIFWMMSFYVRQWIGRKSKRISSKLKYRSKYNTVRKYHNKHLTDNNQPSLWKGGSDDSGIRKKATRKKVKGAYVK